jgi:hypothetical protein
VKKLFAMILLFALPAVVQAADFGLEWQANTEPDLAGYKIYYNQAIPGPPFARVVDVGNVTTCVIPDLDPNSNYYFVCTAYDTSGMESDYSNQVDAWPPENPKKMRSKGWLKQLGKVLKKLIGRKG